MPAKVFIVIVALLLFVPFVVSPLLFALDTAGVIELSDIGAKRKPDKVYEDGVPGSALLNGIESLKVETANIYTNYLPFYGQIVRGYTSAQLAMDSAFDSFTGLFLKSGGETATTEATVGTGPTEDKPYEPVYKTTYLGSDNLYRLYRCDVTLEDGSQESFLETAILKPHSELSRDMEKQLEQINRIAGLNDSVNFYIYIESRFQDTDEFEKIYTSETSTRVLRDRFLSELDDSIKHGYMVLDTIQDRLKHVYKTDHHWTADGIHDGYTQIIDMISADSPEIGKPRERGELHTYGDVEWYGSRSRRSLYYGLSDIFTVYDYKLPEHTQKNVDGDRRTFYDMLALYDQGRFDKRQGTDHYETFFIKPRSFSYPGNDTGRNLLIIGDSYSWGGAELIASNFDNTYVYFPWYNERLNYNKFIEDNDITDVIIMQFSDRIMFNIYNDCPLQNIR